MISKVFLLCGDFCSCSHAPPILLLHKSKFTVAPHCEKLKTGVHFSLLIVTTSLTCYIFISSHLFSVWGLISQWLTRQITLSWVLRVVFSHITSIKWCIAHSYCLSGLLSIISLSWRDLLPLAVASSAPWRWHSSPARLLPWRWLQPGPVCRRRQRRSWRKEGWCSHSSQPRSKHLLPSQRPLPTGRRAHYKSPISDCPVP